MRQQDSHPDIRQSDVSSDALSHCTVLLLDVEREKVNVEEDGSEAGGRHLGGRGEGKT